MVTELRNLVDIDKLQFLFQAYSDSSRIPTAVLDLKGNILVKTNWQDSCTKYHRVNKETCANCLESDTSLANSLEQGSTYNIYRCKNGLVDVATPIKIGGRHVGNFFIGQFFLEDSKPDLEEFREKARKYKFPVDSYIDAIQRVPVYSEEEIKSHMSYLVRLAEMIGDIGANNLKINELNESLKAGVERLGDLNDYMQEMVRIGGWELDTETMESYWTKGIYDIYGLAVGTPLNKIDGIKYYAEHERPRIEKCVRDCINLGTEYDEEFDFINEQGKSLVVRSIGKPVYNEEGSIVKLRGSFQDITEKKQHEKALEVEKLKLLQTSKLATLGEMAAGVAHEINNPLAIVSAAIRILRKQDISREKQEKYYEEMSKSVQRIAKITKGLMKFSRTNEGFTYTVSPLDKIIRESVELLDAKSKRHGVPIRILNHDSIEVCVDELQVEQILINLIGNAIDAQEERNNQRVGMERANRPERTDRIEGTDRIKRSDAIGRPNEIEEPYGSEDPWVEISSFEENDMICLMVRDSGDGISEVIVQKLFDPFYTTKEVGKGTGLGLSISKGIAQEHGGDLEYRLVDNHTAFVLKLPKCEKGKIVA